MLSYLIGQESQHHQASEHGSEVLAAMPKVVFELVALVFQGVEGFVFHFPAGTGHGYQFWELIGVYGQVRYPSIVIEYLAGAFVPFFIVQVIGQQVNQRAITLCR